MKKIIPCITVFVLFHFYSFGQEIRLLGCVQHDSVNLRFALTDYKTLKQYKNKGIQMRRFLIEKKSLRVLDSSFSKLYNIKDIAWWKDHAKVDTLCYAAAQLLFDTSSSIKKTAYNPTDLYHYSLEKENRFSLLMYLADISPKVVQGLNFNFKERYNSNYIYHYQFWIKGGSDTAFISIDSDRKMEHPEIVPEFSSTSNKSIFISWPTFPNRHVYSAYDIERSSDNGKSFIKIHRLHFVPMSSDSLNSNFYIKDTVPEYYKKYLYRIKGITPFSTTGEWSKSLEATAIPDIPAEIEIKNAYTYKNQIVLQWKIYPGKDYDSKKYALTIFRSEKGDYDYSKIDSKGLTSLDTVFIDQKPNASNYYKIVLMDKKYPEKIKWSFPYFFPLYDSIPPNVPENFSGKIDSSGRVVLTWKRSNEKDIYGYRIYKGNHSNEEFSLLTKAICKDTFFIDSVALDNLTESVYYMIHSTDKMFNSSSLSRVLKVKKPDFIPPSVSPILDVKVQFNRILLILHRSTSEDAEQVYLLRKSISDSHWKLIQSTIIQTDSITLIDTVASSGMYLYCSLTKDFSGLQSDTSSVVAVEVQTEVMKPEKINFKVTHRSEEQDIRISWKSIPAHVRKLMLYRSKDGNAFQFMDYLEPFSGSYIDKEVYVSSNYAYKVRFLFLDHTFSLPINIE